MDKNTSRNMHAGAPAHARAYSACGTLAGAALVIAAGASIADAQCSPGWLPVTGVTGTSTFTGVRVLLPLPSGDVIVGGRFTAAGPVAARNIARYSPASDTWTFIGDAPTATLGVTCLALLSGGDVIAAGAFSSVGGVSAANIARYNPSTNVWTAIGPGVGSPGPDSVTVLSSGDVIIGGGFTTAGGIPVNHIVRYSPASNTWSALGSGISGDSTATVSCIAELAGGDLLVGGRFSSAGGQGCSSIARYTPSTDIWSVFSGVTGIGLPNEYTGVDALEVLPSGEVIVGGGFYYAAGQTVHNVARFNPATNTWSPLESGVNGGSSGVPAVEDLTLLPSGDIVAFGLISSVGSGAPANNMAVYSPATNAWSPFGQGVNSDVITAVMVPGGDLLVGGIFTTAGGSPVGRLARHTFGSSGPSINAQPADSIVCPSGTAIFTVSASGGTLAYQWQVNIGTPSSPQWCTLTDLQPGGGCLGNGGGGPSHALFQGVNGPSLSISQLLPVDARDYRCVVTNACGTATTDPAALTICRPDFNCDGLANSADFLDFLTAFFSTAPAADFNLDGVINSADFFDFLTTFFAGC